MEVLSPLWSMQTYALFKVKSNNLQFSNFLLFFICLPCPTAELHHNFKAMAPSIWSSFVSIVPQYKQKMTIFSETSPLLKKMLAFFYYNAKGKSCLVTNNANTFTSILVWVALVKLEVYFLDVGRHVLQAKERAQ